MIVLALALTLAAGYLIRGRAFTQECPAPSAPWLKHD